jgi:hypothetical protein
MAGEVTVAPRSSHIVTAKLEATNKKATPLLVCIETATVPIQRIIVARTLSRVGHIERNAEQLISQPTQAKTVSSALSVQVMLANYSREELTLPKATVLGVAEEISEQLVDAINVENITNTDSSTKGRANNKRYYKLMKDKLDHLDNKKKGLIEPVLKKFAHVFHDEDINDFKSTTVVEHKIIVTDPTPIRRPQYRTPFALRGEMESQVKDMLSKGMIRKSQSLWSAPAILVPKKSLDGKPKYNFCVDFRALNAVTKFDSYPLPHLEDSISNLFGAKYFSILDCYSGFWQVNIAEQCKELTGFTVPSGHYEFNRLHFGLSNSPANFQRLMDVVLQDLVSTDCCIYLDDLLVYSDNIDEHARKLERVLERFERANLQLHPGKCTIAQPRVKYLGYTLYEQGVSASPDKIEAVKNYPVPRNAKDVRAFLGLASFYRMLVPKFAETAKPLTQLTRKNQAFAWEIAQQEEFEALKLKLCTVPVLAFPNFNQPFILTTDASKVAVAAILSQVQDGTERPVAYASLQLSKPEQAYTASEAELLAVVWAAIHFRCYLYGIQFKVRTDHAALTYLKKFSDTNAKLMRWSLKLSELDFQVEHLAGSKIPHVDALSRHVGAVANTGSLDPEVVHIEQERDQFCKKLDPGRYNSRNDFFMTQPD